MGSSRTWAKAPDFADQPGMAARIRAETVADKQLYNSGGMQPVDCTACGTRVLVKKNSLKHTSVQWQTDPAASCPVLRAGADAGRPTARQESCPRLRASISYAVSEGLLDVGDSEAYADGGAQHDAEGTSGG